MTVLRHALSLALVIAMLFLVERAAGARYATGSQTTLALGFLLLAAYLAGQVAARARLPRISGYLAVGVVFGPHALGLLREPAVDDLKLVNGVAVSLIALAAGLELDLRRAGATARTVLALVWRAAGLTFAATAGLMFAASFFLPFLRTQGIVAQAVAAVVTGSVLMSFSPTVAIATVKSEGARGPFTELAMAMVVLGDLVVIVFFALAVSLGRVAAGDGVEPGAVIVEVLREIFGSLAVGAAAGLVFALYLRWIQREVPVLVLCVCFLSAQVGTQLHLSPLLLALSIGLFLGNVARREGRALSRAIEPAELPVFALFFAVAGASLHLDVVRAFWPLALALAAARGASLFVGARRGALARSAPAPVRRNAWLVLVSQAGVSFGLAEIIGRAFPGWGPSLQSVIIAVIAVNEMIGPVLMRLALRRAGEAGRAVEAAADEAHAPARS